MVKYHWTCEEYEEFDSYELLYQTSGVACKGLMLCLSVIVIALLVYRRYNYYEGGSLSRFPLVVMSFILAESVFAIIKINSLFPVGYGYAHLEVYAWSNAIEMFCLQAAVWIFALKYHETASEVQIILSSEVAGIVTGSLSAEGLQGIIKRTKLRRRQYCLFNTINFLLLGLICAMLVLSQYIYSFRKGSLALFTSAFVMVIIETITISATTLVALHKFYQVAQSLHTVVTLNKGPIILQTCLLIVWLLGAIVIFVTTIASYARLDEYEHVKSLTVV